MIASLANSNHPEGVIMDHSGSENVYESPVTIPVGDVILDGDLRLPTDATGIVLFAHGSGSSRKSPRNRYVAQVLNEAGIATLLMDLLTPEEEQVDMRTRHLRFDIGLLSERLIGAVDWLQRNPETERFDIGCFGASTGAAAALIAAAERADVVKAVVSRGGRPDLTGPPLARVHAPTLLIVGGYDEPVIEMNRNAMRQMNAEVSLEIVPRATHLFEEPGALEEVARLASQWFSHYLAAPAHPGSERADVHDQEMRDWP
jgi:putative phosphoribosyl transferase